MARQDERVAKKTFTWKAEVAFRGTAKEFGMMAEHLNQLPVTVHIPDWPFPLPFPGLIRIPFEHLEEIGLLEEVRAGATTIPVIAIQGIDGGIRAAHIHMDNSILFLEQDVYAKVMEETVNFLVRDVTAKAIDHVEMAGVMRDLQEEAFG